MPREKSKAVTEEPLEASPVEVELSPQREHDVKTVASNGRLKALVPPMMRKRLRSAYKQASYFGFTRRCPFCRSHLRRFLPSGFTFQVLKDQHVVGGGYRAEALCPVCESVDRERLLYLFLRHKTDIFQKPLKVLHVAPEARVAEALQSTANLDCLTADISGKNVMTRMDITDIQFPDASFDVIICNHVLEHIVDDGKAMSELYRALKPGGWAILQVPISLRLTKTFEDASITAAADREQAFGQDDHVRIYARDYEDRLVNAGFTITVFRWVSEAHNFGGPRNVFGLNEEEGVYFVTK